MEIETKAVHSGYSPDPTTKAVAVPIYQTTAWRCWGISTAAS
jgi:O-acetylhomoserine (thiol)-lyase